MLIFLFIVFVWEFFLINFILFVEDGGYLVWSDWFDCDVICGGGLMQRYRICNSFFLINGGCDCVVVGLGFVMEFKVCNFILCLCK